MSKDELVESCMNLAYSMAHKFGHEDEWYSAALFGLAKAANNYDESRGLKFSTMAGTYIMNELLMVYRKEKKILYNEQSLDAPLSDSTDDITLGETVDYIDNGFNNLIRREENEEINRALETLKPREQQIIRMIFGIGYDEHMKIVDVAVHLNLSYQTVASIKRRSLEKLRKEIRWFE